MRSKYSRRDSESGSEEKGSMFYPRYSLNLQRLVLFSVVNILSINYLETGNLSMIYDNSQSDSQL